jgi:hypothetical protein
MFLSPHPSERPPGTKRHALKAYEEEGTLQIAPLERRLAQAHAEQTGAWVQAGVRHLDDPDDTLPALEDRKPVRRARHSAGILSTSLRVTARSGPASADRSRFVAGLGSPAFW